MRYLACSLLVLGALALVQSPAMAEGGCMGQVASKSTPANTAEGSRTLITAQAAQTQQAAN